GLGVLPDNLHLLLRIKPHDLPLTIQGHQRDLELAGVQPLLDLLGGPYRQARVEALDLDHVANRQVLHPTRLLHTSSPNLAFPRSPAGPSGCLGRAPWRWSVRPWPVRA